MSKVEEVARAIYAARWAGGWDDADVWNRDPCWDMARAAIAAMREPSEAMLAAVDYDGWESDLARNYAKMIDAALQE